MFNGCNYIIRKIKTCLQLYHCNFHPSILWFCSHSVGEDLSSLGMKELKQLERQTRTAVERVRSKKVMIDIVVIETHNIRKKNSKNVINFTKFFFF